MFVRYHICRRSPNTVLTLLTCISIWLPYSVTVLWSVAHIEQHSVRVFTGILAAIVTHVRRITYMPDLKLTLYCCVITVGAPIYLVTQQC